MLNSKTFSDKFYSKLLGDYGYSDSKMVSVNKVLKMLPQEGKVLDIGCFDGYVLELIKNKNPSYEVYGVDASKKAVEESNSKGLKVFEGNAEEKIPFEDNFFDAVIAIELIEHLADTDPPHMAGHLRFYTHDLLEDYIKYSGFEVVESKSDLVHFSSDGKIYSKLLAELFPKIGRGVLIKSKNIK